MQLKKNPNGILKFHWESGHSNFPKFSPLFHGQGCSYIRERCRLAALETSWLAPEGVRLKNSPGSPHKPQECWEQPNGPVLWDFLE